MTAMAFGCCLIVGFSLNGLTRYNGVKISDAEKHADMPRIAEVDATRKTSITETLAGKSRGPTSFHARKYTSLAHEGLGVDHEEWKAAKEAARRG